MQKDKRTQMPHDYRDSLYADKCLAINKIIKRELTETLPSVRLGDIKLTGIKTILKGLKIADADTDELAPIKKALLENIDTVKAWLTDHGNYLLSSTNTYELPTSDTTPNQPPVWDKEGKYKHLAKYFEPSEIQQQITDADVERSIDFYERHKDELGDSIAPPPTKGETITIKGVRIKDFEGLKEAIKQTVRPYQVNAIKEPDYNGDLKRDGLDPVYLEVKKLNQEIGVEPSGGLWARLETNTESKAKRISFTYGAEFTEPSDDPFIETTDLRMSDRYTYMVLLWTLVKLKNKAEQQQESGHRTIVNIKDAEKHAVILQPHTLGLTDMIDGAFENRDLNNLYGNFRRDGYKNNDDIRQKGQWLAHIDPKQGELPLDFGEKDKKTLVKFMTQVKALVLDTAIALWLYRQEHPERKPDEYIKLIDLARYIERYNDKKLREKNELRPENKSQLLLGLQLAQLVGVDYRVGKDKKGNFEWRRVYLIDRITEYKTYGNTDSVIAVKVNFTKEYLESGGLNIGVILDGVQRLKTSEHKALGAYILERFAQYQAKTIQGLPLTATADTLIKKAGIIDNNTTNKLKTLQEALDQLAEFGIIAKWSTKNSKQKISGYDKESQSILLYPTDNIVNGYTTKTQTQAEKNAIKLEQRNRQHKLKTWFKGYTDRKVASDELGISVAELNEMLAGKKIINDDIIEKIEKD